MLVAYNKTTGKILWNSGTNSAYPDGPRDAVAYQATNTSAGLLRLNDVRDARTIELIFKSPATVVDGKVVIGETTYTPKPPEQGGPTPVPPMPLDDRLAVMQNQIDQLTMLVMLGGLS